MPAGAQVSPVTASVADTLGAIGTVLVPLVARGVIIRRPRVAAVGERLDADRRLVRTLQQLRTRYGTGPLRLRLPLRRVVLVLSHEDAHRVLDASPDPYATAAREKKAVLGRFEPHGVLISDAADRPERRRWNEVVLDTSAPLHHLAGPMVTVVREEATPCSPRSRAGTACSTGPGSSRAGSASPGGSPSAMPRATTPCSPTSWPGCEGRRIGWSDRSDRRCVTRSSTGCVRTSSGPSRAACRRRRRQPGDPAHGRGGAGSAVAVGLRRRGDLVLPRARPAEHPPSRAGGGARGARRPRPRHARDAPDSARSAARSRTALADDAGDPARDDDSDRAGRQDPPVRHFGCDHCAAVPPGPRAVLVGRRLHPRLWAGEAGAASPRAALVPFSEGPAVCAGQNLVLFLTSTLLAALLRDHEVRVTSRPPIRPGRPLPGTLNPFYLRFSLTPRR